MKDTQSVLGISVFVCACWYRFMRSGVKSSFDYWVYALAGLCMLIVPFIIVFVKNHYRSVKG